MQDMVLCNCGSDLRKLRCCEQDPASLPSPAALELLNGQAAEATKLYNEKKHREAAELALKLLDLAPNHRAALRVLFEVRKAENKPRAAEALARRLAGLPTDNAAQATAANLQLAQLLIGQSRHAEAEPAAREAVKNSPRDANAHHVLGVIITETGQLRPGELHYRQAIALRGEADGLVTGNLAWNLRQQGLLEEAATLYGRALAIRPDNRRAIGGFAQVETARGYFAHAADLLDRALSSQRDRSLRLLRAMLELRQNQAEEVLSRLDDPADSLLPAELLLRGQALLRLGQNRDRSSKRPSATRFFSMPTGLPSCRARRPRPRNRSSCSASRAPAPRFWNSYWGRSPVLPQPMGSRRSAGCSICQNLPATRNA
jgi:tetratricopeptide (TPR) repeat protein